MEATHASSSSDCSCKLLIATCCFNPLVSFEDMSSEIKTPWGGP